MSADPDEPFQLRQTSVSRPRLQHTASKQSISAEEEYQSARGSSPRPDSVESNEGLLTDQQQQRGFSTPPSSPPPTSGALTQTDDTNRKRTSVPNMNTETTEEGRVRRKPVGSPPSRLSGQRSSRIDSPPTPGVDDTPYIRFAIDQLTRDEEVNRASRAYAFPADSHRSNSGYPEPTAEDGFHTPPEGYTGDRRRPGERALQPTVTTSRQQYSTTAPVGSRTDVLVPFEQEVPPLRFIPGILRIFPMAIYVLLNLLMLVALGVAGIWSGKNVGLADYDYFGSGKYFVFQYLPVLVGMFYLMWLFQIQIALQRVAPFVAMASDSSMSRAQGPLMDYQPTDFLFPKLFYFRAKQTLLGVCMLMFWLNIFTIPLFANLFNTYYYGPHSTGIWRWNTVQGVVWTLFALYLLTFVALIMITIWIKRQRTGLKWDPRSLADIITLIDRANIMEDYSRSEIFATRKDFKARLAMRSDRLGYWHTSRRPNEVFYGIGEEGAPTRRYSVEGGRIREKTMERSSFPPDTPSTPGMGRGTLHLDLESQADVDRVRHRYLPLCLRPSVALFYTIAAIALFIAFIVVSFVNNAVIRGFDPLTPVFPDSNGFSSTNFTYSFVPTLIAHFLFLGWLSIDYSFRRLQPFAAMTKSEHGAGASDSLLLDYPAKLPVSITAVALLNRNLRIAWYSLLTLIAACLPILAGGCFWAQFYVPEQQIRVAVEPAGYYALCVFLALYAFTLPTIFIGLRRRRLPHACTTLAECTSWLYMSRLLGEREWRAPIGSKTEMVTRLVSPMTTAERQLSGVSEGRFVFGRFIGRDGATHLGIERVGRDAASMEKRSMTEKSSSRNDGLTRKPVPANSPPRARTGQPTTLARVQSPVSASGARRPQFREEGLDDVTDEKSRSIRPVAIEQHRNGERTVVEGPRGQGQSRWERSERA